MRPAPVARLALGGACLAVPTQLLAAIGGLDRDDRHTRTIVRVLGGRLLLQGALGMALGRRTRGLDVLVDLTHAATMLPVVAWWPAHRRSAGVSGLLAAGTALLDVPVDSPERVRVR